MAYVRIPFVFASTLVFLVPDVAFARREPGPADVPAAAAEPVAPAAPADGTAAVATSPAPVAAAPVVSAPAPAPVLPASMQRAEVRAPSWVPDEKRTGGLIAAGAGLLAMTYLFTSAAGAVAIDKGNKGRYDTATTHYVRAKDRIAFGRSLLIPVVGPFLAIGHTDSAVKRWAASMSGIAQVTGAVLLVAGVVAKSRIRRAQRFGWTAGATRGGGAVMIHGRF